MNKFVKLALPFLLVAAPAQAQPDAAPAQAEPAAEEEPVTRQTAVRDTPLLDFEYSWPEAISAETKLVEYLRRDLSKSYDEALNNARENKALMDRNNAPFSQNQFSRLWSLAGQTKRLISLISKTDTYTGGAHPNHNSSALLWDRTTGTQLELSQLFSSAAEFEAAVRPEFCRLLDAERAKRRQGEVLDGEFSRCPPFSELTVAPVDEKGRGSFDLIRLIADPYVAGPYAEGDYDIAIPVSPAVTAALKPEFRSDFAIQRAQ